MMDLISTEVHIAVVSDIHLGDKRNPTQSIISNLNKYLICDRVLADLDVLFLAGDVFDDELPTYSTDYAQIVAWAARLLRKCHHHRVMVRVLEGTRSHDRGQSILFATLNEAMKKMGKGVDLRYISQIEIEVIEKYQLSVLYVPDDLNHGNTQLTAQQVSQKLSAAGIGQVDLAIMHGAFHHQLPECAHSSPMHDAQTYEQWVKHLIFVGHIHTPSVLGKIHAQGSFDRLAHNEEHPKGYFKARISPDGWSATFIENKDAAIYKTITCDHDSVADNLLLIDEVVKALPDGCNLRIEAKVGNPILDNIPLICQRWPLQKWGTPAVRGKDKKKNTPIIDHKRVYVPVVLDQKSLYGALMQRLADKKYDGQLREQCSQLLQLYTQAG